MDEKNKNKKETSKEKSHFSSGEFSGEKEKNFISIGEASVFTGIGQQTIRKMADDKKISFYKTPTGHRRFNKSDLQRLCGFARKDKNRTRENILYSRVSSKKQMDDLSRQSEYLRRPEYNDYILISDIGSGISFKRKGLQTILDRCIQGTIGEVVVAHRDRLSRFAFDLIESIVIKAGGKITVLETPENKSSEQELADDLLSIVHIFSCRQMGKRKYKKTLEFQDSCCEIAANTKTEEAL